MNKYQIVAKTQYNLEPLLAKELELLGATNITILKRAVSFYGTDELLYKANLCLRTAMSILVPIHSAQVQTEQDLYDAVFEVNWEDIIDPEKTLSVSAATSGNIFTHSKYASLKSKDAIVDRLREKFGYRPDIDVRNPDFKINIHIHMSELTISLDSSGTSLDKRGYRLEAGPAPLNEVLAAGILLQSNWQGEELLYDPMCGSGTFSIEAALLSSNTPVGLMRNFCFENWLDFDKSKYQQIKEELSSKITAPKHDILASDIDQVFLDYSFANAYRAGLHKLIKFEKKDFFQSSPLGTGGIILLNPPYDDRMAIEDVENFYKEIGDTLKTNYTNHSAWVISSNIAALKKFGLKASFKTELNNGGTLCKLHEYQLYKGSKLA